MHFDKYVSNNSLLCTESLFNSFGQSSFPKLLHNSYDVRNIRAYLITALYNSPTTIDSYYTALVNHDMYGSA